VGSPSWGSPLVVVKKFAIAGHTLADMGWKAGKLGFTGSAGDVVTLAFADQSGATTRGAALDDVSVKIQ
jgi:hypothetical protein